MVKRIFFDVLVKNGHEYLCVYFIIYDPGREMSRVELCNCFGEEEKDDHLRIHFPELWVSINYPVIWL